MADREEAKKLKPIQEEQAEEEEPASPTIQNEGGDSDGMSALSGALDSAASVVSGSRSAAKPGSKSATSS